ncbi:MAG TPA: hypothetical protein VKV73_26315 [Chloroflexota bacterium]|nr:hypothetical protein [Chloroflexota bacterium]
MDLLLLAAGAIVLIGITLWIVWPARSADPVAVSVQGEEVSEPPMSEPVRPGPAPQGDRFADQYTSATADLSAGGVAVAVAETLPTEAVPPQRQTYLTPVPAAALAESQELGIMRTPGRRRLGVGAVLAVSGGVGGAWLYARWQRERNKPINKLRRNARVMASRLGERIPDVDELPSGTAPVSGAATALLLTALVASRALHRDPADPIDEVRARAEELLRASAQEATRQGRAAMKLGESEEVRKPAIMGIGLGGMALVAGGAFVAWRLLHRDQPDRSTWYAGE